MYFIALDSKDQTKWHLQTTDVQTFLRYNFNYVYGGQYVTLIEKICIYVKKKKTNKTIKQSIIKMLINILNNSQFFLKQNKTISSLILNVEIMINNLNILV